MVDKTARKIAQVLCDGGDQMRYVLTALVTAVQERLGEDIILCPRIGRRRWKNIPKKAAIESAAVFSIEFEYDNMAFWHHYIFYGAPDMNLLDRKELLHITLDVAHELGHLVLQRGPGQIRKRVGISDNEVEDVEEVEANWFALCILQMYGFLSLED